MEVNRPALSANPVPIKRVAVDWVTPSVDDGRFPVKRVVGETVKVTAAVHADGHEVLSAVVRYRPAGQPEWCETEMSELGNDEWTATFSIKELRPYEYTVQAWVNSYRGWQRDVVKKYEAAQDVMLDLQIGAQLLREAAVRAQVGDANLLREYSDKLEHQARTYPGGGIETAKNEDLAALADRYADRSRSTTFDRVLAVNVERERALFSAWYELFPRSCTTDAAHHGTFRDCIGRLDYVAGMGFDVLYLPPIHPIGRIERKGKNNSLAPTPDDVGSPWAIGAEEGGHKAIHPQLGTFEDFQELQREAKKRNLEIALDLAYQCAPDHPYVKEHREWFRIRPDGSVQYAENPPKKYQDIYPLNFESPAAAGLCEELKSVVLFWAEKGVRIFRVDNPHTKPYPFWEWMIREVRRQYPDVIFLAEAFTRPKVMYRLAKLGFSQSYTYFTWRNTKQELTEYFTELTQTEVHEFFRPNLWPTTPDILPEHLQFGGRPAFMSRLILAGTLGTNYGIYGPAYELCENQPQHAGSEEYLNSEKYEIRAWDIDRPDSLRDLITRLNRARHENPALRRNSGLRFHTVDNDQLIAYSKATEDLSNIVLVIVNLDPYKTQSGSLELPLSELQLEEGRPYEVHDLLTDAKYLWHGSRNYVELKPHDMPAHVFCLRRRVQTEKDFDHFM